MPPSGYDSRQSTAVTAFLKSCAHALALEAEAEGRILEEAARLEAASIEDAVALEQEGFVAPVLELTRQFYVAVAELRPRDANGYWRAVDRVLREVDEAILSVHVKPATSVDTSSI